MSRLGSPAHIGGKVYNFHAKLEGLRRGALLDLRHVVRNEDVTARSGGEEMQKGGLGTKMKELELILEGGKGVAKILMVALREGIRCAMEGKRGEEQVGV